MGDVDDDTQANIRTYGKFCSLFEEELAKVEQELVDITEVIMTMVTMAMMTMIMIMIKMTVINMIMNWIGCDSADQ